jgi:hypothetical protein
MNQGTQGYRSAKKQGQKSHDTVPLMVLLSLKNGIKLRICYSVKICLYEYYAFVND